MVSTIAYLVLALVVNHIVGSLVCAVIDKDGSLYEWATRAPFGLGAFVPSFWPILWWLKVKCGRTS